MSTSVSTWNRLIDEQDQWSDVQLQAQRINDPDGWQHAETEIIRIEDLIERLEIAGVL